MGVGDGDATPDEKVPANRNETISGAGTRGDGNCFPARYSFMAHEAFERPSKPVRNVVWSRNCLFRTWPRVPSQWPPPPASSATTTVLVPRLAVVKRNVQNDCLYHIVPLWRAPRSIPSITLFSRIYLCPWVGLGASYDSPQIPHDRPFTSVRFIIYVGTRLTKVTQSRRSGLIFRSFLDLIGLSFLFIVLSSNYGLGPLLTWA